jgi:two-component system OmpR family response regulator
MAGRQKILVADDEASIREILSLQLARMGYVVALAADGEEAVAACAAEKPDLLLLDVMMPRLSGLAACRKIREAEKKSGRRTPILFLTARDTTHDKTSAALSGGDGFIAKPVSMQELREQVENALRRKKA